MISRATPRALITTTSQSSGIEQGTAHIFAPSVGVYVRGPNGMPVFSPTTEMPSEIAPISVADATMFCAGNRRASPTSEVVAAMNQTETSSGPNRIPSSEVIQAARKGTRNVINTGLCSAWAHGDGSWAAPLAHASVGAGLNSVFISDGFGSSDTRSSSSKVLAHRPSAVSKKFKPDEKNPLPANSSTHLHNPRGGHILSAVSDLIEPMVEYTEVEL